MRKLRAFGHLALITFLGICVGACGASDGGGGAPGHTIRIAVVTDPPSFDPHSLLVTQYPFTNALYEPLLWLDERGAASPGLAAAYAIAPDGKSVTLTLRKDVRFHSGVAVSAEAIVRNIDKIRSPETGGLAYPLSLDVANVTANTEGTATVSFKSPQSDGQILILLSSVYVGNPDKFDDFATEADGTGPYRLTSFSPGVEVTMEKNDDYWGDPPATEKLIYQIFDSTDSMTSALQAGEIDIALPVQAAQAKRLAKDFNIVAGPQGILVDQFRLNPQHAPLDNEMVRRALSYALDRESIVKNVFLGLSTPLALPFGVDSLAYSEEDLQEYQFDPTKAKRMLDESGISPDQLTAEVLVNGADEASQRMSQIYQSDLAKIGFKLKLDVRDNAEWIDRVVSGDYEIAQSSAGGGNRFPGGIVYNSFYRLANNAILDPVYPDYLKAMKKVQSARDQGTLNDGVVALRRAMLDRAWIATCCNKAYMAATRLDGVAILPSGHLMLNAVASR